MKLVLLKTTADTHVYSYFTSALRNGLIELGHDAVVSDQYVHAVNDIAPPEPLVAALQQERPDAVVSLSSFFGGLNIDSGISVFDALGIKFVGWQLDHPIYAPASLTRTLKGRYAIYANPNHLRYARAAKIPGAGMTLMPGGNLPEAPVKDYRAREWPVFIAATYNGAPQRSWEHAEDSPGKRLATAVVDSLLRDREASLLDAFNVASAKLRLGIRLGDNPEMDDTIHGFLRDPLSYVRHFDRNNIIRALADAGLPLTICGGGWQHLLGERSNVSYIDRVAFKDIQSLYGNARIVLNLNAGNGGSERAVYAALAGAAIVSDYGAQVDELLGSGQGVAFFNRAKPDTAAHAVATLLESEKGEAQARCGFDRAARSGLWRHRAQQVCDFIGKQLA